MAPSHTLLGLQTTRQGPAGDVECVDKRRLLVDGPLAICVQTPHIPDVAPYPSATRGQYSRPSSVYRCMEYALALPEMTTEENARISAAVAALGPRLRAFVRRQVEDLSEVDDIVQDTLLELVSAYRLVEPIEHLAAWLLRVARNRIIDRFRARSRQSLRIHQSAAARGDSDSSRVLDEWLAPADAGPESAYVREVLADELLAALEELPAEQRDVFVAHELEGKSFKELAAEADVGINTLLGRKHAAVLHLRQRLADIRSEFDI